jgi:hypothetical protein
MKALECDDRKKSPIDAEGSGNGHLHGERGGSGGGGGSWGSTFRAQADRASSRPSRCLPRTATNDVHSRNHRGGHVRRQSLRTAEFALGVFAGELLVEARNMLEKVIRRAPERSSRRRRELRHEPCACSRATVRRDLRGSIAIEHRRADRHPLELRLHGQRRGGGVLVLECHLHSDDLAGDGAIILGHPRAAVARPVRNVRRRRRSLKHALRRMPYAAVGGYFSERRWPRPRLFPAVRHASSRSVGNYFEDRNRCGTREIEGVDAMWEIPTTPRGSGRTRWVAAPGSV